MNRMVTTSTSDVLEALIAEHSSGVYRYLRSLVGDEDTSCDLLHDTFLKLRNQADGAGKALVYTVARNCALDHLRRRRTRRNHELRVEQETLVLHPTKSRGRPDRELETKTLRRDLLEALGGLPEDQRTAFHLSEIEGLSYADIAAVLDVSPGTIASRKHHAVRKLREAMRRRGHDR